MRLNDPINIKCFYFLRNYRVQLIALSANPEYSDSPKSNALFISTSIHSPRQTEAMDDWTLADDQDIPVKVTQITESSIHLDWSHFLEIDGISGYKIQWSSVAQPAVSLETEKRLLVFISIFRYFSAIT